MTRRREPVRTCVGCRERAVKSDLVRVVAVTVEQDTVLQPDPRGVLPGRGAHLHPTDRCLALALRRKAFPRALRLPGPLDASALAAYVMDRAGYVERSTAPPHDQTDRPSFAERADRRDDSSMSTRT